MIAARVSPEAAEARLLSLRGRHPDLIIQLVTLKRLPGNRTVAMIGQQTLRAAKTGALLAAKPEVDLLLRLAGTTQIAVAIKEAGYQARGEKLLVAAGPALAVESLEAELAGDSGCEVLRGEEIGPEGLEMVERAAVLGTRS
ncbi:MAG: KEOPS complex subunit Cgi121 [Thaumarchaeota archaeon]|nr:KEOPS complex subunit Cgi121 [Nitrososphaerota archaeon]